MTNFKNIFSTLLLIFGIHLLAQAQVHDKSWEKIIYSDNDEWYGSEDAKAVAENVLLYQRDIGGWPKNIQMQKPLSDTEKADLKAKQKSTKDVTTDNGATYGEMLFLSKIYRQIPDERYKNAFLKGLEYILEAQYDNGGWPQFYPLRKGYYSHITYNDDSMVNILLVLEHIVENTGYYSIEVPNDLVERSRIAMEKGIDCILKTQYRQNGVLTSWCAQHDAKTLQPAKARAYELPSLSGKESAKIVLFLMTLENPSEEIKNAIISAYKWFDEVKLTGIKEVRTYNEKGKLIEKKIVPDAEAAPIWARFMELDDNTPFFCDRDGIKKYTLAEIGAERRNGYAWYTDEPKEVFKKYKKWSKKYLPKVDKEAAKKKVIDDYNVVVAQDGSGDYESIQAAIDGSKSFPYKPVIITVKEGVYNEKVHIYSWNTKVHLIGESKEKTIIRAGDFFKKIAKGRNSTFHTSTVLVEGNDCLIKNLTIENSAGEVGQAVALSVNADRVKVENCNLLGYQDTLYTAGEGLKQYFKNCLITGSTDFIFGEATVFFENCTIHSKKDSYITAASTPAGIAHGYVFNNCKLTADEGVSEVYLGRPWRVYAKTVFVDCELGSHILKEGWHNWNKKDAEQTVFYAEINSKGPGASKEREQWAKQLKKSKAKQFSKEKVLKASNKNHELWYEK